MNIIETVLLWIVIIIAARVIYFIATRISAAVHLGRLERYSGVSVTLSLCRMLLPTVSRSEAARITVRGKVYSVYMFAPTGERQSAHLASEKFATVFFKSGTSVRSRRTESGSRYSVEGNRVYRARTVTLPSKATDGAPEGASRILLFAPCPAELTYVTGSRTSIRAAFVGDEAFGYRVFTVKSLCRYIDRDSRGFYD